MFEKNSSIFEMHYEIKKGDEIVKIFDEQFVRKNKMISKIIIDNKIHILKNTFKVQNNQIQNLNIKLIILTNSVRLNLRKMFYNCKALKEFSASQKHDNVLYEIHSEKENLNISVKTEKKSLEKENISCLKRKKLNFIYYYSIKDDIFPEQLEYMKNVIYLSHCFSSMPLSINSWRSKKIYSVTTNKINKYLISLEAIKSSKRNDTIKFDDKNYYNSNNIFITNLSDMFNGCTSLKSISFTSKWNTINTTNISRIFENCYSLNTISDISEWKTDNCYDMNGVFSECKSLLSIPDISK